MNNEASEGKTIALVSYCTIIGTVIAIFMNNEKKNAFAAFHTRQALGIFLTFFALGYLIGYFDSWTVTFAFWIFIFALWVYGFTTALQLKMSPVPMLGEFYQKIFKSIP